MGVWFWSEKGVWAKSELEKKLDGGLDKKGCWTGWGGWVCGVWKRSSNGSSLGSNLGVSNLPLSTNLLLGEALIVAVLGEIEAAIRAVDGSGRRLRS